MTLEHPLVVGVDGSEGSDVAVDWAVDEAARHGLALRLVHASLWERYEHLTPSGSLERPAEQVLAEHIVASAAERARRRDPDVKVLTDIVAADATDALLSEGERATALVTGCRGRGGLKGLLLGSVSLAVAARATCPVIVVRGDKAGLAGTHGRILLGAGDAPESGDAAEFAFREAECRRSILDAVRAWRCPAHEPAGSATGEEPARHHERQARTGLDDVLRAAVAAHPGVRVRPATVEGPAHKVLVLRSAAADLVVVGARRTQGRFGLQLGRVAHTLLHHSYSPVAVVPQRG
ncbi:Universal stress protein [Streptomyces sp. enrichment culture]|uniref:universal stress protein n=1 Tax=Streptomyces sp. enrichment culture TaxID=1795815 RepID=UPI003F54E7DE